MKPFTITVGRIRFDDLDGIQFERLVFAYLLRSRRDLDLAWTGQAGQDGGRDIWGAGSGRAEGSFFCALCANHRKLTFSKVKTDLDKVLGGDHGKPGEVLVACGGEVSAKVRDRCESYAAEMGIERFTLWSGADFEEHLRRDAPELLRRFVAGEPFPDESVDLLDFGRLASISERDGEGDLGETSPPDRPGPLRTGDAKAVSLGKSDLVSKQVEKIAQHVANPEYFRNIFSNDTQSVLNLLQDGGQFSPTDIKRLAPLCEVCSACGRGERIYAPLQNVCQFTVDNLLPDLEHDNALAELLINIARAEYTKGNRSYAESTITLADTVQIDPTASGGIDLVSAKIRVFADLDNRDLSRSREWAQFKGRAYGRNSVEHVKAIKCWACKAVGTFSPKAEQLIAELEDSVSRLPSGPAKFGLERDTNVLKATMLYFLHKRDHSAPAEQVVQLARQAIHYPEKVESLRKVDGAFLHFVIGDLEGDPSQFLLAETLLSSTSKGAHCVFDINWLRAAIPRNISYWKPCESP